MKTDPITALIGLALILLWAVATLLISAVALVRFLQALPTAPAPRPVPTPPEPTTPTPAAALEAPAAPCVPADELLAARVRQLRKQGLSQVAIGRELHLSRSRVRRLLAPVPCAS